MTPSELSDRLLDFAADAIRLVDSLPRSLLGRHIAGQLVRCSTSPGPNYEEGCASESKKDFIHKLSICLKELRESRMWFRLIQRVGMLPDNKSEPLLDECTQLCKILAQSAITAKGRGGR